MTRLGKELMQEKVTERIMKRESLEIKKPFQRGDDNVS